MIEMSKVEPGCDLPVSLTKISSPPSAHRHPDNARAVGGRLRIELGKLRADDFAFPRSEPPGSELCPPDGGRVGDVALRIDKARAVACEDPIDG